MSLLTLIPIGIAILILIVFVACGYVKAPPDMAYIISGLHKKPRILVGRAGFKLPFIERLDKLSLGTIQIDVKTGSSVPTSEFINVRVDSNVNVRINKTPEMIEIAAENFLNAPKDTIGIKVRELLEGNIREIVGQMKLTDMVRDRKAFSEKVQENAVPDLEKFGLELISFNVQNFVDDNGVIEDLGIDNVEQIRKQAAIAKSDARREVQIAEATNAKMANDARVNAEEEIAIRNNALAIKQAELKLAADTEKARADAASSIEAQKQRQLIDVAATNADIAKAEREAELKQKEIELREYELDAIVRKQADAEKYATEKKAEADLIRRQKEAEAKAFEIEQQARAQKTKADADKYSAEQQAAAILAVGEAEAEAIRKKAEAQKQMGEASVLEMYFNALPKIVASASGPLEKVDKIVMYGDSQNNKIVGDVMSITNQVTEGLAENGIDFKALMSSIVGGKIATKD